MTGGLSVRVSARQPSHYAQTLAARISLPLRVDNRKISGRRRLRGPPTNARPPLNPAPPRRHSLQNPRPASFPISATTFSNFRHRTIQNPRTLRSKKIAPKSLISSTHERSPRNHPRGKQSAVISASDTATARAIDLLELAPRRAAHTSRNGSRDTGIVRAFYAPDIFQNKNGNADCALRNSSMEEQPSCVAARRDRNFCRLAYRIGERQSARRDVLLYQTIRRLPSRPESATFSQRCRACYHAAHSSI